MNYSQIRYLKGDATQPVGEGQKIIVHVCNNIGAWGAGFVMALSNRWKEPEQKYRSSKMYTLGTFDLIRVEDDILVCNLIGQEGTISNPVDSRPPIRYDAIRYGLQTLGNLVHNINKNTKKYADPNRIDESIFSIHMPMIGTGLAGGRWEEIEPIINDELIELGVDVTVYQFE